MILLVLVSQLTPRQGSQANVISSDMDLASTRSHSRGLRNRRARVRQPEVRKSAKPSLLSQFKETVTAGNRNSIVLALEELAFTVSAASKIFSLHSYMDTTRFVSTMKTTRDTPA
jgi:hypothetical protein